MSISNEALSTEVPTLAAPILDASVTQEIPAGPPLGSDRWVDAGLAMVLHNRLRADGLLPDGSSPDAEPDAAGPAGPLVATGRTSHRAATHSGFFGNTAKDGSEPLGTLGDAPGAGVVRRLAAALVLGLMAAFLGWVSAAPFWLAHGVGERGSVVIRQCDPCVGVFVAADGEQRTVRVADLAASDRAPGTTVGVRLLDGGDVAYAGPVAGLHLRWALGFALVLACGVGVALATGVPRLRREGPRKLAILWGLSLGGPAALALIPVLAALVTTS